MTKIAKNWRVEKCGDCKDCYCDDLTFETVCEAINKPCRLSTLRGDCSLQDVEVITKQSIDAKYGRSIPGMLRTEISEYLKGIEEDIEAVIIIKKRKDKSITQA